MLVTALAGALALAGQDGAGLPQDVGVGGFCTGMAWVSVIDGRNLSMDHGPDFLVFRYDRSPLSWWGVYTGRAARVSGSKKKLFFIRHGVKVSRVTVDGEFRGYLAVNRRGEQNHFYGSPFHGDASDKAFFDKVDFGPEGRTKCKETPIR